MTGWSLCELGAGLNRKPHGLYQNFSGTRKVKRENLMKVSRHFFFHLLAGLAILVLAAGSVSAQSIYGSIRGLVTDPSAAIVANAKVTLINEGTSGERSAQT